MSERKYADWATDTYNLTNGDPNKEDPGAATQALGWIIGKPLIQHFNWWMNLIGHFSRANNSIKVVATGYEAEVGETVLLDNSSAAATGLLPADPVDGQKATFGGTELFTVYTLTINGNGNTIMDGTVTDILLDIDSRLFIFNWNEASNFWEISLGDLRGAV